MDYIDALDILDKTFVGNLEAKVLITKAIEKQIPTWGDSDVRITEPFCKLCGQALDFSDECR